MPDKGLNITAIPAFQDNYIWLIETGGNTCAVVDPGDEDPVLEVLAQRDLELTCILLTHHHPDHTGGVPALKARFGAHVFGPNDQRMPFVDHPCSDGDTIELTGLDAAFHVLEVPAHTRSHIAFHGHGALFCGDTLFSQGCGRLFEGTAADMQAALDKLAALPQDTLVYCAHEYTQSNCQFALAVEPGNDSLQQRAKSVAELRARGAITLPTTLKTELATNPFMRTRQPGVVEAARRLDPGASPGIATMAAIRAWKDRF